MKSHIGEQKRSKQGLTLVLKKWISREKVQVEILETHERQWVSYKDFRKGKVIADFINYPFHNDCTFTEAKIFTIAIISLIIAAVTGLIYFKTL